MGESWQRQAAGGCCCHLLVAYHPVTPGNGIPRRRFHSSPHHRVRPRRHVRQKVRDTSPLCVPWLDSAISPHTITRSSTLRSSARFWKEILATSVGPSPVSHVTATLNLERFVIPEPRTICMHRHHESEGQHSCLILQTPFCASLPLPKCDSVPKFLRSLPSGDIGEREC